MSIDLSQIQAKLKERGDPEPQEDKYDTSYIPKRHRENLKCVDKSRLNPKVHEYLKNFNDNIKQGRGIWIGGSSGKGKTFSLCWLSVQGKLAFELLTPLRAYEMMFKGDANYVMKCGLLLLDDLDHIQKYQNEHLFELLKYRHENLLSTWFTSNTPLEKLSEKYGDAGGPLIRRIKESCGMEGE